MHIFIGITVVASLIFGLIVVPVIFFVDHRKWKKKQLRDSLVSARISKSRHKLMNKMFTVGIPVYYRDTKMIPIVVSDWGVRFFIDAGGPRTYCFKEIGYSDLMVMYAFITTPMLLEDKS